MDAKPILESLREGGRQGLVSVWVLARTLVPTFLVVDLLQHTPVLPWLARNLEPAMGLMGLPGEAAMVMVAGYGVGLYAALGALVPLHLSPREITILGLVLSLAHGLVVETAVLRQLTHRWPPLLGLRVGLSLLAGVAIHQVLP